jgi:hypothetical protein
MVVNSYIGMDYEGCKEDTVFIDKEWYAGGYQNFSVSKEQVTCYRSVRSVHPCLLASANIDDNPIPPMLIFKGQEYLSEFSVVFPNCYFKHAWFWVDQRKRFHNLATSVWGALSLMLQPNTLKHLILKTSFIACLFIIKRTVLQTQSMSTSTSKLI